jgi:hypothetical protein
MSKHQDSLLLLISENADLPPEELLAKIKHFVNEKKISTLTVAHKLVGVADWALIDQLLPPGTNFFNTSGWLRSIAESRPVDTKGDPIPWLNYAVIDFIDSKLKKTMKVWEWGSGYSTIWFSERVGTVESVEDDYQWYEKIRGELKGNAKINYCDQKRDYVEKILESEEMYDVIQIDGSHRSDCAKIAIQKLQPNGFIVFDNSDSKEFDDAIVWLEQNGFYRIDFLGLIPSYLYKNCTSILFRDAKLLINQYTPSKTKFATGDTCFQKMSA